MSKNNDTARVTLNDDTIRFTPTECIPIGPYGNGGKCYKDEFGSYPNGLPFEVCIRFPGYTITDSIDNYTNFIVISYDNRTCNWDITFTKKPTFSLGTITLGK